MMKWILDRIEAVGPATVVLVVAGVAFVALLFWPYVGFDSTAATTAACGHGGRRRKRRAAEEPYAGPKVEHLEQKGPRRLTRRERKASR